MWPLFLLCLAVGCHAGDYLLPRAVMPSHYTLRYLADIDPDTNFTYYAVVDIMLNVKEETKKIVLHAQDFTVDSARIDLTRDGKTAAKLVESNLNDTFNFLTLTFTDSLPVGDGYLLTIPFRGYLTTRLDGVYISSYVNKNTEVKEYLISTQFEAISARKGFPCFDEPIFKATFTISLGYNKEYEAVSNMPQEKSSDENALEDKWPWTEIQKTTRKPQSAFTWSHFQKSVPMSTYLVAFVVSKFGFVESPEGLSKTKFRIWARKDAIDQAEYASRIGPQVLSHYESYFNVSFPLPKQDMMAIPDFSAGAMENWGLITYRETALLYDKEESSLTNKERVAEVIAHELAHQWFGNLVTMKWWSDLWLNEGFATYVASVGVAAAEPAWQARLVYAAENILAVLALDALESSHPVSIEIDDPKRIDEIFDEISYKKGSTLIRMMVMFLGEDTFREGITNYLKKYSYSNAEQNDLWRELTSSSRGARSLPPGDVTVRDVMDTWTTQTGYPLLTVTRDYSSGRVTVTQHRFLSSGRAACNASWWVPLRAAAGRSRPRARWLAPTQGLAAPHHVDLTVDSDDWLLLNDEMIAPLRVTYDAKNWELLSAALNSDQHTKVPLTGKVQLLSDAFALAASDRLPYQTALKLASYLQHETEYLPLSTGLRALNKIENSLKRSPDYGAFQKYIRKLIGGTYEKIGGLATKSIKDEDDLSSVKLQVMVSSWACRAKVAGCEESAVELFQQWMDSDTPDEDNPIPRSLRRVVSCAAVSRGGVRQWRWAAERRARSNVAAARDALLAALACSRDVWLLNTLLEWSVSEESPVRRQDAAFVVSSVLRSPAGYFPARDFLYRRLPDLLAAFKGQARRIGQIVKTLLEQFTTQQELDEFMVWAEKNQEHLEASKLTIKQGIEKAKVNIAWVEKHSAEVVAKLREYAK